MYAGIFEDLVEVRNNLKEVGVTDIDDTKIFDLLEDLKNPKVVSQILIEAKQLNDPETSRRAPGPSTFSACSDFIDDQTESDVEVIKEVRKEDKIKTVDLTNMPEEHFIPDKVTVAKKEPQDLDASWPQSVEGDSNEDSNLDESTNQINSSNDSDVENYYTTSDYEDPDADKIETDQMKAESPPPILSILKDLCENHKIPEQPAQPNIVKENVETENSEFLEENNNDPNNNNDLEEIQVDQPPRSNSPVAGCSKDFDEKESRRVMPQVSLSTDGEDSNTSQSELRLSPRSVNSLFSQESVEPKPSCSKEFNEAKPQSPIENGDEIEELDLTKSSQTNYEQLLEETQAINRLFPDTSGDVIFSMLDRYKKASNRVMVVLWDLMPRERPELNIPKKRKQNNDHCPTERKKISPSGPSSKIGYNIIKKIQKEVRSSEKRVSSELNTFSSSTLKAVDKSKSPSRACVIQPPKFIFDSKPVPENNPKPPQKQVILAAPKLIINPKEKQSNFQQAIAKPAKRKLTSATKELTEEGFVIEGTESVNSTPNVSPVNDHMIQYKVENNDQDALRLKIRKSKSSDRELPRPTKKNFISLEQFSKYTGTSLSGPVKQVSHSSIIPREIPPPPGVETSFSLSPPKIPPQYIAPPPKRIAASPGILAPLQRKPPPPPQCIPPPTQRIPPHHIPPPERIRSHIYPPMPVSAFQKYIPGQSITPSVKDRNTSELQNSLNEYWPVEELEEAVQLDFLNPNRQHQFYQMPRINKPPPYIPGQESIKNCPGPSTSYENFFRINEIQPAIIAGPSSSINLEVETANENRDTFCKDTYYKLRSIFPEVDPEFIKNKCLNPPFNANGLNKEHELNMLVEILLAEGTNHRQAQSIEEETDNVVDKDVQYENLLEIFPEADPTYLRDFVDKNHHIPDSLKDFVARNLEKPNYPTRAEYLKKVKITEQIRQYTSEFDIKKFLQIFPDPVAHFENPDRISEYNAVAFEFLKEVFCKHKIVTISQIYKKRKHHLSLTACYLRQVLPDMKNKRSCVVIPTENIPLLQEMAYVRHKQQIVAHLEEIKKKEEIEFNEFKAKGKLLECQCCFSDECMPSKCASCEKGHLFCHSCILRGTESKMGDGQNHITCFSSCDSEFSLSVLQEVLPPTTFSILLQKRQESEVMAAGLEGLVSCPFCHFASIPPAESKVFKCLNPDCMKETCRLCKELNHVPLKCDEIIKPDDARRHLEEKMTEALVRTCYQCQKQFFKEEGCNKMTCVCGASMCYLCSTPLYKNKDYSHFNGQGAVNLNLCPLWSDNRRLNAEAVRKVAEVTENEMKKRNPNLQLNAQALLPALPPKTRGPHDDIPNANQMPEHIRRVAHINP